jgi:replicative DNA helicase
MKLENGGYIKDTSLNFCRQQVLKKSLKDAEEIMNNGEFEQYGKIENLIISALQVGTNIDNVSDMGENIRESLQSDNRVPFPTGIEGIDNLLKGGLARGELGIVLAPTGIGKTTVLTKFANSAFNCGANVLHMFFEDPENIIKRKHYTIWTGIASDDQKQNEDEVVKIVSERTARNNRLKLCKLSPFGVSVADIKTKIRKLYSEGCKIDVLVLDYIDCISLERSIEGEEWKGEGTIMRTLEGLTDEFNIAIWTATQGNRNSMSAEVVTADQMGGNIKKAQIGHVVLSIAKSLEQKEHNLANITLLKSRIGKDGVIFQNCKFNNEYLEFNTETQNTLLGHEEERVENKKQHAAQVYKESLITQKKVRAELKEELKDETQEDARFKMEAAVSKSLEIKEITLNELHNLEEPKDIEVDIPPIDDIAILPTDTIEIKDVNTIIKPEIYPEEIKRKHAAEVYKQNKMKVQTTHNTG